MDDNYFIKHRISFQVAPYALYDAIKALTNDNENVTKVVLTKEDNDLIIMVAKQRKQKPSSNNDNAI